jgi:aspartate aminotransferase
MGAFYLIFSYRQMDSLVLAGRLLDEKLLAVVPGQDFGADRYVRISYATSMDNVKETVRRLNEIAGQGR